MEIDHIRQEADGGPNTPDNGIPLCFDCHAEVHAYNHHHPRGRRFTESELRKHRDQWFTICAASPWARALGRDVVPDGGLIAVDEAALDAIDLFDATTYKRLAAVIGEQDATNQQAWVRLIAQRLRSPDERTRWKAGIVAEEVLLWQPKLISADLVECMSNDTFGTVRTCAAMCYYHLAVMDPAAIPVFTLARLASDIEDWYVSTPATSAMLRLARRRPVVVDLLARGLSSHSHAAREHAAWALQRLACQDWDLVSDEIIKRMRHSADRTVYTAGEECAKAREAGRAGPPIDYFPF